MTTSQAGLPRRLNGRRWALWTALAFGWIMPTVGCQVEYAGMTLPSGKYMHDDVQYFPAGPDFPWANTQAATQRSRMRAMGMEVPPEEAGGSTLVTPPGAVSPVQMPFGRPADVNQSPLGVEAPIPAPGAVPPPAPGGALPAPVPGVQ
jgi:hypothetical protein